MSEPTPTEPLLEVLRLLPGEGGALAGVVPRLDPLRLVADAARHGLAAVVERALEEGGFSLGSPLDEALHRHALAVRARAERARALLGEALDVLWRAHLTPALLKGYGLACRLYPEDPLARAATDADLWIEPGRLEDAERALEEAGFTRRARGREEQFDRHRGDAIGFVHTLGLVELHFRPIAAFGTSMDAEAVWSRTLAAELDGFRVRFLAPADELVLLAVHAAKHLFGRLSWLFDVKRFLARYELRWEELWESAREQSLAQPTWIALSVAERAVGARVPPGALAGWVPPVSRRWLAERLFSDRRLVESPWDERRARYVVRALFSNTTWLALRDLGLLANNWVAVARRGGLATRRAS